MKIVVFGTRTLLVLFFGVISFSVYGQTGEKKMIYSVRGSLLADDLKFTLTHEHLMSNFGKDIRDAHQYDEPALFKRVIPYLKKLKDLGVNSIFDCTTAYFGRRVDLLKKMADSTGINIITNTGFYGAANDRYVPDLAYGATAEEISEIWIDEFEKGINGTGIRPGFIKLAFDEGKPSSLDKKLFTAGILTHLKTGLTITVHTMGNVEAAKLQLSLLEKYQVDPSAWVWIHAHQTSDNEELIKAAEKGAWISLDGANESNINDFLQRILVFKEKKLLHKLLLSHDGDGFPMGGEMRKFEAIPKHLIPALLQNGYTELEINQLMELNPREAFGIRVRKRK